MIHGVTPRNSPALRNKIFRLFFAAVLVAAVLFVTGILAQDLPLAEVATSGDGIRWYRSNASGMALEQINSRLAALRNDYSLSVQTINPSRLPSILPLNIRPYYNEAFRVELRILYKEGSSFRMEDAEVRRQWIFRTSWGMAAVVASGTPGFFDGENRQAASPVLKEEKLKEEKIEDLEEGGEEEEGEEEEKEEEAKVLKISGIIEMRNNAGFITRELQFDDDLSEWDFRYFYRESTLLRTETWFKDAPLPPATEEEASLEEPGLEEPEPGGPALEDLTFENFEDGVLDGAAIALADAIVDAITDELEAEKEPPMPPPPKLPSPIEERKDPVLTMIFTDYYRYTRSGSLRAIDRIIHADVARARVGFPRLGPGAPLNDDFVSQASAYTAGFFMGVTSPVETMISYNLDSRGRILGEVWKDENGKIIGELKNTWSGDRLQSVLWTSKDENRLIEYEYDNKGNTRVERNFSFGELERVMTYGDGRDTEEIYMNGRLILRAYWENGRKVREERIFSMGNTSQGRTSQGSTSQ